MSADAVLNATGSAIFVRPPPITRRSLRDLVKVRLPAGRFRGNVVHRRSATAESSASITSTPISADRRRFMGLLQPGSFPRGVLALLRLNETTL
jgi:hypothetical protein